MIKNRPDGVGPNLEIFFGGRGTAYYYLIRSRTYFLNPSKK
jgi:hypothetical protein